MHKIVDMSFHPIFSEHIARTCQIIGFLWGRYFRWAKQCPHPTKQSDHYSHFYNRLNNQELLRYLRRGGRNHVAMVAISPFSQQGHSRNDFPVSFSYLSL